MDVTALVLSPATVTAIKTVLIVIHLLGLILGLGAATLLDLLIVKFVIRQTVTEDHARIVEFASKVVTAGLILLWISGLGFLLHYDLFDPMRLTNEKVWAKIAIVAVLTLNGLYIHWRVLPLVRARIGQRLFEGLSRSQRGRLLTSGAVSGTSWYIPMLLGAIPQLNFVVPAATILLAYGGILLLCILTTRSYGNALIRRMATVTLPRAEYEALLERLEHLQGEERPLALAGPRLRSA